MRGVSKAGTMIAYGDYALVATSTSWITGNQIESARIAINRYIKRGGKLHIKNIPS